MSFWSRLLGTNHTEKPPAAPHGAQAFADTQRQHLQRMAHIPYDSRLIQQLQKEHHKLLELFGEIHNAFAAGDVARAAACMRRFTSDIQVHLLTEQIELYVYLQDVLAGQGNQRSRAMVRDMQREMDAIGDAVLKFLNKYRALDREPALNASFGGDLDGVGAALVKRVNSEESALFPLYLSQAAAA